MAGRYKGTRPCSQPGRHQWPKVRAFLRANYKTMSLKELGAPFGVTFQTVHLWLKKLGLKKPMIKRGLLDDPKSVQYLRERYQYTPRSEMAAHLGVTRHHVWQLLKSLGLTDAPHIKKGVSPELARRIEQLWNSGMSASRVARTLRLSEYVVKKYVREALHKEREHEYYFHALTPESAYILGFIYADGNVSPRQGHKDTVSMTQNDRQLLRSIQSQIGGGSLSQRRSRHWALRFSSDVMSTRLQELGALPAKSKKQLHVPREITDELLPHFMRGLVDGDGSVRYQHGHTSPQVSLAGSYSLMRELRARIRAVTGFQAVLSCVCHKGRVVQTPNGESKATVNLHGLRYGVRTGSREIAAWLYANDGLALKRKKKTALSFVAGA